jgi:predicted transcriptional regulator
MGRPLNFRKGSTTAISPSDELMAALERLAEQNQRRAWWLLVAASGQEQSLEATNLQL